jgi:transposase-like protein
MSEVSQPESQEVLVTPFNAHVFRCPYCKDYTTLLSTHSFISFQQTECENCRQEFVIENDCAHALAYASVGRQ